MPKSTPRTPTRARTRGTADAEATTAKTATTAWPAISPHILVVSADPNIHQTLSQTLTPVGYTLHGVEDGPAAIRRAEYIYYPIIVLALPLQGLATRKAITNLHDASPESEILVLATLTFLRERLDPRVLGVVTFLAEPYTPEHLVMVLARAVERQRLRRRLTALSEVAYAVGQLLDLPRVLDLGLDRTLEMLGRAMGAIYVVDEESGVLVQQCCRGLSAAFVEATRRMDLKGDAYAKVLSDMQPVHWADLRQARTSAFASLLEDEGARSAAVVPLRMQDQALGMLVVAGRHLSSISLDDMRVLMSIGQHFGVAVAHGRLHERERRTREHLTELLLALQQQAEELRNLSGRVVRAQEAERQHIARELHDGIGQVLTALRIDLGLAADLLPSDPVTALARVSEARDQMGQLMNDVRRISAELRPSMLDDLGLVPTLNWLTDGFARRLDIPVTFEAVNWPDHTNPDVEIALFRIVQEAINNAVKHAHPKQISVQLIRHGDEVLLNIEDDGLGFDVVSSLHGPSGTRGSGLRGMRERVTQLGGEIRMESQPKCGTRIHVRIDLAASDPAGSTDTRRV